MALKESFQYHTQPHNAFKVWQLQQVGTSFVVTFHVEYNYKYNVLISSKKSSTMYRLRTSSVHAGGMCLDASLHPSHWCHHPRPLLCHPLPTFPPFWMIPALILTPSIPLHHPEWEAWRTIGKKIIITWNGNPGIISSGGLHMSKLQLELKYGYPGHVTLKITHSIQHARHTAVHAMELVGKKIMWKKQCMKGRSMVSGSRADVPVPSKSRRIPIPTPYWEDTILITPTPPVKTT